MLKQHKKLIMYLFKPFTGRFVLLSALLMLIAVLDAAIPYATKIAIDRFITPMTTEGLVPFATLYAGIILVFGTLIVIFIILAGKLESGIAYRLRKESFDRMQDYNFSYFDEEGVGKVLSKITSDIGKLSDIISWGLVDLVWSITFMGIILGVMFVINWQLAAIVSIVVPILVLVSYFFQKRIFFMQKDVRKLNSEIIRLINEGITGAITSKTLVTETKNTGEFKEVTENMKDKSIKSAVLSSIYTPVALNIGSLSVALVVVAGGFYLDNHLISLGTLILSLTTPV